MNTAASADTDTTSGDRERGDEEFRAWMRGHLDRAADEFDLILTGKPVFGWCLRSISAQARPRIGDAASHLWLRVGTERVEDLADPFAAAMWTGLVDANTISGVTKPATLASADWIEPAWQRRVRADVMTFLPGHAISESDQLAREPDLPASWWTALRTNLDTLANTPTTRFADQQPTPSGRVRKIFGDRVAGAVRPVSWTTVHGDLHWSNVLGPDFGLLDWELWGRGPAGLDAATLYLFSLRAPQTSARVREVFADILDTADGRRAQIVVASRILVRARQGHYAQLAAAVRREIQPILDLL